MKWAENVARLRRRGSVQGFDGKSRGKEASMRPRIRLEDNIEINLIEIGCGVTDYIHRSQDRDKWRSLANTIMNLRDP
jgi:hypothetical protein